MFKRVENQDIIEQKLTDGTIKRYVKGRLLGKGGFAKCYQFTSLQTEKKYAAKVIEKASLEKSKAKQKLTSQIKIHKSLDHEYIVHFEHFFEDAEYVYILLEKCSNQTLNQLLKRRKRLTDIESRYYIRQLAEALLYIQQQKVIHRDLKLGNLFLSDKLQIKIGDFGLATRVTHEGQRKKTKCGTPNYIAPEILDDKKSHSYQVDVWSMGVIAYTLLVGKPPFETNDVKLTYNRIKTCNYSFPNSVNIEQNAKQFISKMLQLDPCKRPTLPQILSDPYMDQSSIPQSLPISSLACPPSSQFIKKYKQLQKDFHNCCNNTQSMMQKSILSNTMDLGVGDRKITQKSKLSKQKSVKNINNFNTRMQSSQKNLSSANRVFSTVNFATYGQKTASKPAKKKQNLELASKSVKLWVSYFEQNFKFGIGYILNSNSTGFRYNDSTVMIANCKSSAVKFIDYNPSSRKLKQDEAKIYKPEEAEQQQHKKYKILHHFDRELRKKKTELQAQMPNQARIKIQSLKFRQSSASQMKVYVIRYHRTDKSTVFWFNNRSVQIIFQDFSELLLSQHSIITYVNKYGDRSYFHEQNRQSQPQQIKKRVNYFMNVVHGRLLKKSNEDGENQRVIIQKRKGKGLHEGVSKGKDSFSGSRSNSKGHLLTSSSRINEQRMKNSIKLKSSNSSSRVQLRKNGQNGLVQ